jgi:DNA-binding response OmpR family regulator
MTIMKRILVIEDEKDLAEIIKADLNNEGYVVD